MKRKLILAVYPLADTLYRHGYGSEADYPEAFTLFMIAAKDTHKDAQFYLGRMYHFGHGTDHDYSAARKWYTRAIESGSVRAANNLGNLWCDGDGGPEDLKKGMDFFRYASNKGMAMASYNLAQKYRTKIEKSPDWDNALRYYELAVNQAGGRYADAAYWGGWIYLYGKGSITTNPVKAKGFLEAAVAEEEHRKALFSLAWIYESGKIGVPDLEAANQYYRRAAEAGHIQAMSNLAWNLWDLNKASGMKEAIPYFEKAIEAGNNYAMNNFGYLNLFQKWPQADPKRGLELIELSAQNGHKQAMKNLAYYYDGEHELVSPDPVKAAYWRKQLNKK